MDRESASIDNGHSPPSASDFIGNAIAKASSISDWKRRISVLDLSLKLWLLRLLSGELEPNEARLIEALGLAAPAVLEVSATAEAAAVQRAGYGELIGTLSMLVFRHLEMPLIRVVGHDSRAQVCIVDRSESPTRWRLAAAYYRLLASAGQWMLRAYSRRSLGKAIAACSAERRANFNDSRTHLSRLLAPSFADPLFAQALDSKSGTIQKTVDALRYLRGVIQASRPAGADDCFLDLDQCNLPTGVTMVFHVPVAPLAESGGQFALVSFTADRAVAWCSTEWSSSVENYRRASGSPAWFEQQLSLLDDLVNRRLGPLAELVSQALIEPQVFLLDLTRGNFPVELAADPQRQCSISLSPLPVTSQSIDRRPVVSFWGCYQFQRAACFHVDESRRQIFSNSSKVGNPLLEYPHLPAADSFLRGRPDPLVLSNYERWMLEDLSLKGALALEVHSDAANRADFLHLDWASTSIIHLSTHAEAFAGTPECSNIFLGLESGLPSRVHLTDVLCMDLSHIQLVFLNCCVSQVGKQLFDDDRLSLAWGFLAAGARAVIAHRWHVRDGAAWEFSKYFYRALIHESAYGLVRKAFHQAVHALRELPRWASPKDWGTFVLMENPWSSGALGTHSVFNCASTNGQS